MKVEDRVKAAVLGVLIGDALAMPSHWFYDGPLLKKTFGKIEGYVAAPEHFPNSYMNTGDPDDIIGSVIMHGKKKYWEKGESFHYHYGLKAGENTLDGHIFRLLLRYVTDKKGNYKPSEFVNEYVKFMTTPDNCNDKFAPSTHRTFFKNYKNKEPLEECIGEDEHDEIDAIYSAIPAILLTLKKSDKEAEKEIKDYIFTTKFSERGVKFSMRVRQVLKGIEGGKTVKEMAEAEAESLKKTLHPDQEDPIVSCQIDKNYLSMLHFMVKYPDFKSALLANANAGGENVARGQVMGAIFGFAEGVAGLKELEKGLLESDKIIKEADEFAALCK